MRIAYIFRNVLWLAMACNAQQQDEGNGSIPFSPRGSAPYSLSVHVNEVRITFQALNDRNVPVSDLKADEIDVFDNGNGPEKVISLQRLDGRPIHAALLIDTSGSVASGLSGSRVAAQHAVEQLLTRPEDEGTATAFGRSKHLVQNWTSRKETLRESIGRIGKERQELSDGTSLFDSLFSTCFAQFGADKASAATNVILLFSDGEDTASFGADAKKARDKCLETHVLIYAFSPRPALETNSMGVSTLHQLIDGTGGRLFYVGDSRDDIGADINLMVSDLHEGYLVLYRPTRMRQDGSFHKVVLVGPKRVASIVGTAGYYAPTR